MRIDLSDDDDVIDADCVDTEHSPPLSTGPTHLPVSLLTPTPPPTHPPGGGHTGGPPPTSTFTAPLSMKRPPVKSDTTQEALSSLDPAEIARKKSMADKHSAMIRRIDDRIRDRAMRVSANAMMGDSIDDGAPKPPGWSDRMYRTAMDARKCEKEAPMYLKLSQRILDSYKRVEAIRPSGPPQLNAEVKVYVRGDLNVAPVYKVVDLPEE